jgi:hypothetical protein
MGQPNSNNNNNNKDNNDNNTNDKNHCRVLNHGKLYHGGNPVYAVYAVYAIWQWMVLALVVWNAPAWSSVSMEGHTGYLAAPSALLLPDSVFLVHANYHPNTYKYTQPFNAILGFAPLPFTELLFRFAGGDLSLNGKIAYNHQWMATGLKPSTAIALGIQDLQGGMRFFHSKYGVITQSIQPLKNSGIHASLGWGSGPVINQTASYPRLHGWFVGAEVFTQMHSHKISLLYDYDSHEQNAGVRYGFALPITGGQSIITLSSPLQGAGSLQPEASAEFLISLGEVSKKDFSRAPKSLKFYKSSKASTPPESLHQQKATEYAQQTLLSSDTLSSPSAILSTPSDTLLQLEIGPTATSFLGTEVGLLDFQLFATLDAYWQITQGVQWATRINRSLYYTKEFRTGGQFAAFTENPWLWEHGGLAVRSNDFLTHLGWTDGLWAYAGEEYALTKEKWQVGAKVFGYLDAEDLKKEYKYTWQLWALYEGPWGLFTSVDVGYYWYEDYAWSLEVGRKLGVFAFSARGIRSYDEHWQEDHYLEGRLSIEWNWGTSFTMPNTKSLVSIAPLRPVSHGYRTRWSRWHMDHNGLRPGVARQPLVLQSLRK